MTFEDESVIIILSVLTMADCYQLGGKRVRLREKE